MRLTRLTVAGSAGSSVSSVLLHTSLLSSLALAAAIPADKATVTQAEPTNRGLARTSRANNQCKLL